MSLGIVGLCHAPTGYGRCLGFALSSERMRGVYAARYKLIGDPRGCIPRKHVITQMDKKQLSERDICTKFITPALRNAGWDEITQIR